jgi:hypothetical protein
MTLSMTPRKGLKTELTKITLLVHGCEAEWILVQRVTEQAIKIRKEDQSKRA